MSRDVFYGDPAPLHRFCLESELCASCGDEMGNHGISEDEAHDFAPSGRWRE